MRLKESAQWMLIALIMIIWVIIFIFLNLSPVEALKELPKGTTLIQYEEPCSTSSFKSWMDYGSVTDETSKQWYYIHEVMHIKDGYLLDDEGYIGLALGTAFGDIGSRWIFQLSSGQEIYGIKIEHKADEHTIDGCYHKDDSSVIEFVIDSKEFPYVKGSPTYTGNFNDVEWFEGNIVGYRKVN